MVRDKSKDLIVTICPELAQMIHIYKLNIHGAGKHLEDDEDFVTMDLEQCNDRDNFDNSFEQVSNILGSLTNIYLLYWKHTLDVKGFVQFILCILEPFQRLNVTELNLLSNMHSKSMTRDSKDNIYKREITKYGTVRRCY